MRTCEGPREMYMAPCGRHCHSGSVYSEAFHACARSEADRDIGMPRNSPTYGLPVLSSSCTGAHSPEKSIWANAGAPARNKHGTSQNRVMKCTPLQHPIICQGKM